MTVIMKIDSATCFGFVGFLLHDIFIQHCMLFKMLFLIITLDYCTSDFPSDSAHAHRQELELHIDNVIVDYTSSTSLSN